ncbi:MAG: hypothetical protein Q8M15_03300 [Bacteroidota bacterium]|nr:hypothetical protein [Bacteroidota bacterium]
MKVKKLLYYILFVSLLGLLNNCRTEVKKKDAPVTIDFDARMPGRNGMDEANSSSVILRVQLVGSKADLIKYGLSITHEQRLRNDYYMLKFSKDIYLISGADTIPCVDSHSEQLYMDLPYRTFILNFGEYLIKDNDEILVIDRVFSNKPLLVSIHKNL